MDATPDESATDEPTSEPDLGDAGKKALEAERKARREAERHLKDLQAKVQQIEDSEKSETQRLADKLADAEKRATDAEVRAIRTEIAAEKGLTPAQAKRLVGTSREELEADAEDLLDTFKPAEPDTEPSPSAPRGPEKALRGGSDPTQAPEEDVRDVVASIPRSAF